jgi:hypothetical protein
MLTLSSQHQHQYISLLAFKRPVEAMRHPQTTTARPMVHYVSVPVLVLRLVITS